MRRQLPVPYLSILEPNSRIVSKMFFREARSSVDRESGEVFRIEAGLLETLLVWPLGAFLPSVYREILPP
jgi:hypothetical protein